MAFSAREAVCWNYEFGRLLVEVKSLLHIFFLTATLPASSAGPHLVVAKDHVDAPVQAILDTPERSHSCAEHQAASC